MRPTNCRKIRLGPGRKRKNQLEKEEQFLKYYYQQEFTQRKIPQKFFGERVSLTQRGGKANGQQRKKEGHFRKEGQG